MAINKTMIEWYLHVPRDAVGPQWCRVQYLTRRAGNTGFEYIPLLIDGPLRARLLYRDGAFYWSDSVHTPALIVLDYLADVQQARELLRSAAQACTLYADGYGFHSLSTLDNLEAVDTLVLRDIYVPGLDFLRMLPHLRALYVRDSAIGNLRDILRAPGLEFVSLDQVWVGGGMEAIARLRHLRGLTYAASPPGTKRQQWISELGTLEQLLVHREMWEGWLGQVAEVSEGLRVLAVDARPGTADLAALSRLRELRALEVKAEAIDDLAVLLDLSQLRKLTLDLSTPLQPEHVAILGRLKQLWSLEVRAPEAPQSWEWLCNLRHLRHLRLTPDVPPDVLQSMARSWQLETLHFSTVRDPIPAFDVCEHVVDLTLRCGVPSELHALEKARRVQRLTLVVHPDTVGFEFLPRLADLEELDVSHAHRLGESTSLCQCTQLKELTLHECTLPPFVEWQRMKSLTYVYLSGCFGSEVLEPLLRLPSLVFARIEWGNISRISEGAGHAGGGSLRALVLADCDCKSLEGVGQLAELRYLQVSHCPIQGLKGVEGAQQLRDIEIDVDQPVRSIAELARIPQLQYLSLTCKPGTIDPKVLSACRRLRALSLPFQSTVQRADWIGDLSSLEELDLLYWDELADVGFLRRLAKLRRLRLWSVELQDLRPLSALTKLEWLDAMNTDVTDISFTESMPRLMFLSLGSYAIDLKALRMLVSRGAKIRVHWDDREELDKMYDELGPM